ncbi:MAG: UDP-N-acetylglucosamine 1-carboxyvinyltransferase, partial [Firmicutes bacterium]|nr:UDP-N-acetylglucosamine 1-carboxyvinyltransferase [Bacillota bacterium]
MPKYIIEKTGPLHGTVAISGAKNAVLPILAATLLTDETCEIYDVPALSDVEVMVKLLESIGSRVSWDYRNKIITVESGKSLRNEAPRELVSLMRGSIFAMGPLLARTGRAKFPLPGGCAIGARPVDLHKKGFEALKATVEMGDDYIEARARELLGGHVYLDFPSVGATENIMMAATLAEGTTVIENAAEEPEITDLAVFLNKMGAKVKGAGSAVIRVEGVPSLHGTKHAVIPDRIETGSFMIAAAITGGDLLLTNVVPGHVSAVMSKLSECGVRFEETDDGVRVRADEGPLVATDIKTMPYPGFPTDLQSQFMSLLTVVRGHSTVTETI